MTEKVGGGRVTENRTFVWAGAVGLRVGSTSFNKIVNYGGSKCIEMNADGTELIIPWWLRARSCGLARVGSFLRQGKRPPISREASARAPSPFFIPACTLASPTPL